MYKFEPILKTLVWGTENWVISALPGSESVVAEGPEKGKKISEIYPGQFPLLIKFIDAHQDLSIQVHPDDEIAARKHGCSGKTEMWYVVKAEDRAHLICGLKEQIDPEKYVDLVRRGEIESVLADHKVAAGDVFYIPAGRIHAISGGCYISEIQQTSDITYRIFDYNRPGLDGKPRQLHTKEAKEAIDYTVYPDYRIHYTPVHDKEVKLLSCPYFTTSLYELDSPMELPLRDCGDFLVVIALEGKGRLSDSVSIEAGEAVLVPAKEKTLKIAPDGQLKVLTTHI